MESKEDFSDLAPNQRRKKLQQRIDEINTRLLQETATRDGLMKMKGVYEQNRALGDPLSIEGQLSESGQRYLTIYFFIIVCHFNIYIFISILDWTNYDWNCINFKAT